MKLNSYLRSLCLSTWYANCQLDAQINMKVLLCFFKVVEFYFRLVLYTNRTERSAQLLQQPEVIATTVEEVSSTAKPLVRQLQELPRRIKNIIASLPDQEVCFPCSYAQLLSFIWLCMVFIIGGWGGSLPLWHALVTTCKCCICANISKDSWR